VTWRWSVVGKITDAGILAEPTLPTVTLKTLLVPGNNTDQGVLVKSVSIAWFDILKHIGDDPNFLHQLDWRNLEELVAGAYRQSGWDVILTPPQGDGGIDIIATRSDLGQLRFIDQCKAYGPNHPVGVDEVREMVGVLDRERNVTKGIITTTSTFTSGSEKEYGYLMPYRLELKPRDKLIEWLGAIAKVCG
jgi:predicted Mrr-cat superfamily restriction endonuclease